MRPEPAPFSTLAVYVHQSRDADLIGAAARAAGLGVLDLPRDLADSELRPRPDLAWRCPPGLAVHMRDRGTPLPVTGASPRWFAAISPELTGRRLQALTVQELLDDEVELANVAMVKLGELKYRHFPARRVTDLEQARSVVAGLPRTASLLIADRWLECHSEYRVFCAADRALTCSPYRIEDELWSPQLWMHRASFHAEAQAFVAQALADLAPGARPPGCVLDVGPARGRAARPARGQHRLGRGPVRLRRRRRSLEHPGRQPAGRPGVGLGRTRAERRAGSRCPARPDARPAAVARRQGARPQAAKPPGGQAPRRPGPQAARPQAARPPARCAVRRAVGDLRLPACPAAALVADLRLLAVRAACRGAILAFWRVLRRVAPA